MADWPKRVYGAAFLCLLLALLMLLFYAIAPFLVGENEAITATVPVISMLLIVLAGVLAALGVLAFIYEIAVSKNDGQWKAIWIIAIFIFGFLGVIAYALIARKDLKR